MRLVLHHHPLAVALVPLLAALWLALFGEQVFGEHQGSGTLHQLPLEAAHSEPLVPLKRQSATFILGEDGEAANRYFDAAFNYYSYTESERTEYIITSCRSLREVRNCLDSLSRPNKLPWGRINLIMHSNEWSDMGVAVLPNGARASKASIEAAVANNQLLPLPNNVIDEATELVLHGCALGRNLPVLEAARIAFGGNDGVQPQVRSSKYFILYESDAQNGRPFDCTKYLADAWYTHYPTGYQPATSILAQRLRSNYPDAGIEWQQALAAETPATSASAYHYEFKLPVVWYTQYGSNSERPTVATDSAKTAFLAQHLNIQTMIAEYGLEQSDLTWTVYPMQYDSGNGNKVPAIKAIGLVTMVCVLQPFTNSATGEALVPPVTDQRFYAAVTD